MKIDGRCHCGYIAYEAEIDPDKTLICHCTDCQTLSGSAFRVVAYTREDAFTLLSGELKIYVKTSESGNKDHNRSARNVERQFMQRRRAKDPRRTPFVWAPLANATRSFRMRRSGFDPRSHGSLMLSQFGRSKSSRGSTRPARYISLNGRKTPKAGLLRDATSPLGPEQTSGALSSKSAFEGTTDIAIRSRVRSASLRFEGH